MSGTTIGEFGTYVAPNKDNPYEATFVAFNEATKTNPDASWTVTIDAAKEIVERNLIAQAAHKVNKTARLRARDDSKRQVVGQKEKSGNPVYSGEVTLTFTLTDKHKARRGKGDPDNNVVVEDAKPKGK